MKVARIPLELLVIGLSITDLHLLLLRGHGLVAAWAIEPVMEETAKRVATVAMALIISSVWVRDEGLRSCC
jgi:hypothetical protein